MMLRNSTQVTNGQATKELENLLFRLANREEEMTDEFKKKAIALLKEGADLVTCDGIFKDTFFHWLVNTNFDGSNDEEIKYLLKQSPSLINLENKLGQTPLFTLLLHDIGVKVHHVKKLVQLGARLDVVCHTAEEDKCTLLHLVCLNGNKNVAQYLLDKKLDINAKTTKAHNTPLIMAAANRQIKMIEFLISQGADINAVDCLGRKAREFLIFSDNEKSKKTLNALDEAAKKRSYPELFSAISRMRIYGISLEDKKSSKGEIVIQLADQLTEIAEQMVNETCLTKLTLLKKEFEAKLNSQNKAMHKYRLVWGTIIKNIAIAVTVFGLFAIAAKLAYSKAKTGRATFFYQKDKTTSEEKLQEVRKVFTSYC